MVSNLPVCVQFTTFAYNRCRYLSRNGLIGLLSLGCLLQWKATLHHGQSPSLHPLTKWSAGCSMLPDTGPSLLCHCQVTFWTGVVRQLFSASPLSLSFLYSTCNMLLQDHHLSFSVASHLHQLWACHPALQGHKHHDSPSSWLSGPRGPSKCQHTFDLSFWEIELSHGYRDQKVLLWQQGISLSLLFV